ncbi:5-formyltetrahydrofolate cyclo-ligase [Parablautia intestinalis]|jgi:5-formyltetrahydrofolate cyclo-ligase|uniref:5-formyltetrahydrofolate cyclo-ligase n=1 Tax=Parablautia intestinalis TaxID=2320100 RepID=A0A3A9AFJ5_9FIRM|nr:5-formyltetrahydrofolate cyclo-ligase [Parablautia intestinalis]MCI8616452.1 5-formyltetrahydrofolate cyclo-ligase [Lachnospiraceae bacterium]MDE7047628.1 5-formyltetrahydrofolate cyclo-ligase [Lachnospiraceae bacterium]RKI90048.1 5-formyltetrahydrofolate cyclo-ligase [Parablautia intestinalis]
MIKTGISSKQELRSRHLAYRDSLSLRERKEKSERIWEQLKGERAFREAVNILVYMDYRSEVMTTGLVEELFRLEKRVFAPKVEGMDIRFYQVDGMEDFVSGYQGIREPKGRPDRLFDLQRAKKEAGYILVPLAVFDRERGRMGYGKGFYDRFLAAFPVLSSAGLAFACQMAGRVPVELHDKKPDIIITEKEIIR